MSHPTKKSLRGYRSKTITTKSSARASSRWQFEKPDKAECVSYTVPPDRLAEFLASGLTVQEFLGPILKSESLLDAPPAVIPQKIPSTKSAYELKCAKELAIALQGQTEVTTEAGRIDVLTVSEVIELKMAHNWKHGIGQLLVYGFYFPDRSLHLVLVGSNADDYLDIARQHCQRFRIQVSVYEK